MQWLDLLRNEVERSSVTAVAEQLGVSRSAISLTLKDAYPGKTDNIRDRVIEHYGAVACPFMEATISREECQRHQGRQLSAHTAQRIRHWRACQSCRYRTEEIDA